MQEAMRQREAEWQGKKVTRADSFAGYTRLNVNNGPVASNTVQSNPAQDSYVIESEEESSSSEESDNEYDSPRDGHVFGGHESKGKFAVCDHCRSHGLPCDEDAVCAQCIYHEVACVHHWCKLSKASKEDCPRTDCRYVHNDHMPTSEYLECVEWLLVPGNLRGYMSAGRIGRLYGTFDRDHESEDSDPFDDSDDDSDDGIFSASEVKTVKAIQEEGLAEMTACVARCEASWETVVLTCDCVVQEQEEGEARLQKRMERMAKIRRGDAFLIRYE